MDVLKKDLIDNVESSIKDFKTINQALWLNDFRCDPRPYDDGLDGFLKRAKERIYSATREDIELAYDECVNSGIKYPNGFDVLKVIGNKVAKPEDKELLTDVYYGIV